MQEVLLLAMKRLLSKTLVSSESARVCNSGVHFVLDPVTYVVNSSVRLSIVEPEEKEL